MFSVFHGISTITLYSAVNYIPVGTARALAFTGKMIFNVILFWGLKYEKATIYKVIAIVMCVAGSVLIIQPPPIFSGNFSTLAVKFSTNKQNENTALFPSSNQINITGHTSCTFAKNSAVAKSGAVTNTNNSIENMTSSVNGISDSDDIVHAKTNRNLVKVTFTYSNALIGIVLSLIASMLAASQQFMD